MNIDEAKKSNDSKIKFRLRNATIYSVENGYTFSKYMDDTSGIDFEINDSERRALHKYLRNQLQHNKSRFENQVKMVRRFVASNAKVLDVGCGGGAFLSLLAKEGFECYGIELEKNRAAYAANESKVKIFTNDLTHREFIDDNVENYDCISFWDVIEHVNYPSKTLSSAARCLKKGGIMLLDTPAKDAFYHITGELIYKITFGKMPFFLNAMYSEHPFGHKQIFSTSEMKSELEAVGLEVIYLEKIHELSFPYDFYLKKLFKSENFAKALSPLVKVIFKVFPIRNKMVVVAKKL